MSKIKIISKSYYLCDNENNSWFEENIGSKYAVSEDDLARYGTDRKFAKNEPMASHLLYTVSGTLESSGKEDSIRPEITGMTYGTRYGCMSEVEEAEKKIRLRQHRIYRDKEKAHPSLKLNTQKYVHFSSAGRTESSRQGFPVSQIQIRQCEHDIQFGGLFSQTPISCFSISE